MGLTKNLGWLSKYITADSSGQIGIGCTPVEKFHVNSGAGNVPALFESTDPIAVVQFKDNNSTGLNGIGGQTNDLIFYSNNNINMRLNSSGNLGIGTASPTSIGGYTALTVNSNSNGSFIDLNNTDTNNFRLLSLPGGDVRLQSSSQMRFDTNGSERMRIFSSGNVFIGPSPSDAGYKLDVNGTGRFSGGILQLEGGAYPAIQVRGSTTGGGGIRFLAYTDNYAEIFGEYQSAGNGILIFRTLSSGSVTERMRITSSGNVRIGTSTVDPSENLTISKTLPNTSSQDGGVLGLSNGYYSCKITSYQEYWLDLLGLGFETTYAGTSSTRFRIYANGNYQFWGSNISDARAKENINNLDFNATEKVMALQAKSYYMKNDESKLKYGFIAQEVYEVLPDLVNGDFEEESFVGLDYNGIIPVLVKAIQELTARLEILENK
jgi:hypothetical protein